MLSKLPPRSSILEQRKHVLHAPEAHVQRQHAAKRTLLGTFLLEGHEELLTAEVVHEERLHQLDPSCALEIGQVLHVPC